MVLGIGEGSLDVILDKYSFQAGETISGKVALQLSAPKQARALRIDFYGEIIQRSGRSNTTRRINQVTAQASGERMYNSGESLPFTITIPSNLASPSLFPGMPNPISNLLSVFVPKPTWYVQASLDAPLSLDINKRVQVVLLDSQGRPI